MQHRLFLCLLLMCNLGLYAQTITVKDIETNEPIELVTLTSGTKLYTTINSEGQADVSKFKDAEIIEIRSLGYKTIVKSFEELTADSFLLLLKPSNLNLDEVVISASKWRRSSDDVPAKVISISPREVALRSEERRVGKECRYRWWP